MSASPDAISPTDAAAPYSTPLASLTRAIGAMGRAESQDAVIETLRSTARSLIGCEGIAIIRREGDLCHYVEEDAIGPLWKGHKFPMSACISGWAMLNRRTASSLTFQRMSGFLSNYMPTPSSRLLPWLR